MKTNNRIARGRHVVEHSEAALEHMKLYCGANPASPSAMRHPQLFFRGDLWIALLGPSIEEGIVGIGPTVAAALRAFDVQYVAGFRPPGTAIKSSIKAHPSSDSASVPAA